MKVIREKNPAGRSRNSYRTGFVSASLLAFGLVLSLSAPAQRVGARPHFSPPPRMQQPRSQPRPSAPQQNEPRLANPATNQARPGHLPEWLNRHQNLTPQQQEDALRREPGFKNLPQDQQQRLLNRLHTLDSKPPQVRQRLAMRNEMYERLSPEQKANVRGALQAFQQMPADRQTAMRRAFQDLRAVPPEQRQSVLDSSRFQQQFSPRERTILGNMLRIEPYEPRAAAPQP
ncbi:DUF3106 domain-containing protein [Pseudacidobacterium ailaaui]|jgi:hypothetical protein|uniref:DUF3106 domain-containing protein n=1 Tax=Pseudacidobacterium ailaaui TaxID=1382359 RepID=UPI000479D33B|nr:DUF3106 domain-containing protein [Pseudacidobacterium ailaaui]MBX6361552.1 DUF3106 domain-containing protein [Pseudacidobacterium ailaaui]MCL6464946.1 DUF3106 domain-containing protein [Pseudacidobacterium ailaaui]MDI3255724.1 DUF3106 domain-containing protein [Bacillota bacterium]